MEKLSVEERVELLEDAQTKINEAIELIREAVYETSFENSSESYLIGHLDNWVNGNNPYDEHIPKIIEELEKGE